MRRWFLRKFVWLAAVLFLTTAGAQVFAALLPGDPAVVIAGMSGSGPRSMRLAASSASIVRCPSGMSTGSAKLPGAISVGRDVSAPR